jgi:fucose 4-O-acetylase-like acetyltransferase
MFLTASKKAEISSPTAISASSKISWVYHARGIAIMLIVYRHIVLGMKFSGVPVSTLMYNFQMVFFNFRMPAFFILSGVFIAKSLKRKSAGVVARDKSGNLLYPYLLWAAITLIMQISFSQFSNARRNWDDFIDIIAQPRSLDQLWYLLALFNTSMLYLFLNTFLKRHVWVHILIAAGLHYLSFFVHPYSLFSDFFYFYLFFLSGVLASEYLLNAEKRSKYFKTSYLIWILPLFFLGQWFWFTNKEATGPIELLFILINYIGCYVLFMAAMLIAQGGKSEWLAYIGAYSLYIYILHVQVAAIVRKLVRSLYDQVDPWILLTVCFLCGILFPIFIINRFRKYGIERLFTLQRSKEAWVR